jgi:hypothetical protein
MAKANSQITKGNWLVGGSGSMSIIKNPDEKVNYIQLSPNIGHFFLDKFAAGLKLSFTSGRADATGSDFTSKNSAFLFGPFARYYFLKADKPFNILLEGNYQHGMEKKGDRYVSNNYSLNAFSFATGPVIYFNSSVGLEFLLGYGQSKYTISETHENRFQVAIGLQFHLEKE